MSDTKKASPATEDAQSFNKQLPKLSDDNSVVNSIKAQLGDIPSLWKRLNLPGEPPRGDGVCCSPFREDKQPSFSIYDNGQRWKDHAEGTGGDTLDFFARAKDITTTEAISELRGEGRPLGWNESIRDTTYAPPQPRAKQKPKREPMKVPQLDRGSIAEMNALRQLRALDCWAGIDLLYQRGMFGFSWLQDGPERVRCFMLTDPSRRNAAARRLDGKPWQSLNGKPKSKTLAGSQAGWPIGTALVEDADTVFMVEGEVDALALASWAAFDYQGRWAVVSMTGTNTISEDALPHYRGKFVYLLPDNDQAGLDAARKRYRQLSEAGATVKVFAPATENADVNDAYTEMLEGGAE